MFVLFSALTQEPFIAHWVWKTPYVKKKRFLIVAYLWENRLASRQVTMKDAQASSSSLYLSSTPTRPLNIDQQSCSDPRTHPLLHCTCFLLHRRTNAARSWGQWNWWSLCAFINIKTLFPRFSQHSLRLDIPDVVQAAVRYCVTSRDDGKNLRDMWVIAVCSISELLEKKNTGLLRL